MILSPRNTLEEGIKAAEKCGFSEEFIYKAEKIWGKNSGKAYDNENCELIEYCLQKKNHNSGDSCILFLIECIDGAMGYVWTVQGMDADPNLAEFLLSLPGAEQ